MKIEDFSKTKSNLLAYPLSRVMRKTNMQKQTAGQYSHKWRHSLHQGTVPYSTVYFCHFFHDVIKFCLPNGRQEMASI